MAGLCSCRRTPLSARHGCRVWSEVRCFLVSPCALLAALTLVFLQRRRYDFSPRPRRRGRFLELQRLGGMCLPFRIVHIFVVKACLPRICRQDPASPAFVSAVNSLNDALTARGSYTCPTNCSCDQVRLGWVLSNSFTNCSARLPNLLRFHFS